jgi:hydrogenase maturation protease
VKHRSVLLIGYGNPGRLDDGLGPALAAEVEGWRLPGLAVESDYQLTLEDAEAVAGHDVAILADAADRGPKVSFTELTETEEGSFSTHSVTPPQLLGLAKGLFGSQARVFVMAIRGYEFNEYEERLSAMAQANLDAAASFLRKVLPDLLTGREPPVGVVAA